MRGLRSAVGPSTPKMKDDRSETVLVGLKVGAKASGAGWRALASVLASFMWTSGVGGGA